MARFRILGPIELADGERPLAIGGPRQRALLAYLLLHANRGVSADQLVEALWRDGDPAGATKRVQVAVTRLRKVLDEADGSQPLRTLGGGYVLDVGAGDLDAQCFEERLGEGRRALREGDPARAAAILRDALGLWRGLALAEVAYEAFAQAEIRRLDELRAAAVEARVDADLRLGRHAELIGELEALVTGDPTRERLAGQLMLALYRSGRQADALAVYQRSRTYLAGELGIEPGPELRALQADVLEQAPSLELAAGSPGARVRADLALHRTLRLPVQPTLVLGRASETRAVIDLLLRDDVQLVTLLGAGGVGKTTVAIEVAQRIADAFANGLAFVDLAPLGDARRVADSILQALSCSPEPGVAAADTLRGVLADREQLLVLDNFEHLLAGAPALGNLLDAAPRLTLLVTSRAALDLRAEHRYPLAPLPLPESPQPEAVAAAAASALFIARAAAQDPAFRLSASSASAIARVCARLDGLPLAIELAAARCSVLSPEEIAHRLDLVLPWLGSAPRDAPERQRTLRATLDWSYELLDERERAAFARLAVFSGGCTVDAAEHVTGAPVDVLQRLIAKSMLSRRTESGETRLTMLQPVHEYAAERLAACADNDVGEFHSGYYLQLAEAARAPSGRVEQLMAYRRLDVEADNIRGALARDQRRGAVERVLRLATALEEWWQDRASWVEGAQWIDDALGASGGNVTLALRADALRVLAQLRVHQADLVRASASGRAALELHRDLGDATGVARCLALLAAIYTVLGDSGQGQCAATEAVRVSEHADTRTRAFALQAFAGTTPDLSAALSAANDAAALYRLDDDQVGLCRLWGTLGLALLSRGATDDAEPLLQRSFDLAAQAEDTIGATFTLGKLGILAVEQGDDEIALQRLAETLVRCRTYGLRRPVAESLAGLAAITARTGDLRPAARLTGAAAAMRFSQSIEPAEQRVDASILEPARRELGELPWRTAYETGLKLGVETALRLGLQAAEDYRTVRPRSSRTFSAGAARAPAPLARRHQS